MPGKPGELGGGLPCKMAARGFAETTQLEDYSSWVEKSMGVRSVHGYFLIPARDKAAASLAKNSLNRLGMLFPFYISRGPTTLFLPVHPETIDSAICFLHRNSSQ